MNEEYEIIFIPNEGRANKKNITRKIYYSEFQIIEEKNKEIERLNNIINELEELYNKQGMYGEVEFKEKFATIIKRSKGR